MNNTNLQHNLKLYYRANIKYNSFLIRLDPSINIRKLYPLYMKSSKYYKLYYFYIYYIYVLFIGTL